MLGDDGESPHNLDLWDYRSFLKVEDKLISKAEI
jgi:hypothetical protein